MSTLDFEDMFDRHYKANQRSFSVDRKKTLGASEVFACIRRGWFKKFGEENGFAVDDDYEGSWGAMERGNLIENYYVVPAMRNHLPKGVEILLSGEDQETLVKGKNSATPDGLIVNLDKNALEKYGIEDIESDCIGLEIKSIDPRVDLDKEKEVHHGQAQTQMGIIRELTEWRPVYTVILYVDASFLDKISVFVVKFDPQKYKAAKVRANALFSTDDPFELRPEGKLSGECSLCDWKGACSAVTTGGIPTDENSSDLSDEVLAEAKMLIEEERALRKTMDGIEEDHKLAQQKIKDFLAEHEKRKIKGDGFSVSWSSQKGRKTLDKDALVAAGINVDAYMKEGEGFDKLNIRMS